MSLKRLLTALVMTAFLAIFVAACGDDDDEDTTGASAATTDSRRHRGLGSGGGR